MKSKSQIASSYTESWKKQTEKYKMPDPHHVLITGATCGSEFIKFNKDNIGGEIYNHLASIMSAEYDVGDIEWGLFNPDLFTDIVFCHGVNHMDWFEDQPDEKIIEQVNVNLTHTMRAAKQFVNANIDKPVRKSITFIGSMAHRSVLNGSSIYCAAKAGLNMFARCLAWELAPKGFDVYIIHPSNVQDAPMSEATIQGLMRYRDIDREEAEAYWGAVCPSPRGFLTKGEIADLVYDLVSGAYPYMAGSAIELIGGQR